MEKTEFQAWEERQAQQRRLLDLEMEVKAWAEETGDPTALRAAEALVMECPNVAQRKLRLVNGPLQASAEGFLERLETLYPILALPDPEGQP